MTDHPALDDPALDRLRAARPADAARTATITPAPERTELMTSIMDRTAPISLLDTQRSEARPWSRRLLATAAVIAVLGVVGALLAQDTGGDDTVRSGTTLAPTTPAPTADPVSRVIATGTIGEQAWELRGRAASDPDTGDPTWCVEIRPSARDNEYCRLVDADFQGRAFTVVRPVEQIGDHVLVHADLAPGIATVQPAYLQDGTDLDLTTTRTDAGELGTHMIVAVPFDLGGITIRFQDESGQVVDTASVSWTT